MFCGKCGSKLLDGYEFCMKCGTKIDLLISEDNENDVNISFLKSKKNINTNYYYCFTNYYDWYCFLFYAIC